MDEPEPEAGIYTDCPLCGGLVSNAATHTAWHDTLEGR